LRKIELATRDDLEERLYQCLARREMPDYFLYLDDSGVSNWLALSGSGEFPVASRLTDLLERSLPSLIRYVAPGSSLVSIGVGSGEKERMILAEMARRGRPAYYAVDISSRMVDTAMGNVAGMDVEGGGVVAFLEDMASVRPLWSPPVLLCLLGNNFCNYDADHVLAIIHQQLTPDDLFLLDCHLFPADGEGEDWGRTIVEQVYRCQENVRFNADPLVRRGLSQRDCVFHLDLVPVETSLGTVRRTSKFLRILKDTTLLCGQSTVRLAAGDIIRLGFTYKYTRPQVEACLESHGFERVELFTSPGGDNLLALVRKRPA
jgi:uncharacterized SAM-dependent methyltransferase